MMAGDWIENSWLTTVVDLVLPGGNVVGIGTLCRQHFKQLGADNDCENPEVVCAHLH
jgi:hypothetical protein